MKPKNTLRILSGSLATLLFTHSVQATTLYWDTNQTTDNVAGAITGAWDGTANNWNDDATGGGAGSITATTTDADDLVLSSGSVYTAGTVTIGHAPAASSITFKDNIAVTLAASVIQNATAVTADNGTDTFTYTGTAVQDGQVVTFGGTPPVGLTAGQVYYIISATATTYQVSSTPGGASIDITDDGTSVTHTVRAALTIGGTGAKSGIFVNDLITNATTVSAPIILAANSTFQNSANAALNISGGITGTGDLTVNLNATTRTSNNSGGSSGGITFSTGAVNHVGKIIMSGTGSGDVTFNSAIGSNVTEIRQSSTLSHLTINGGITVNAAGTTISKTGVQSILVNTGAIGGTGDLILDNDSNYTTSMGFTRSSTGRNFAPNGIYLESTVGVNNTGNISNTGAGTSFVTINGNIGSNVGTVTQSSATSNLLLFGTNTYTGKTFINAGILSAVSSAALSSGNISFGGGTLQIALTGQNSFTNTFDVSSRLETTGNNAYSIDTNGCSATFATGLAASGTSGLTKLGSGTLTLSNIGNAYTGTTTIGGGTGTLQKLSGGTLLVTGTLNGTTGTDLTFKGTGTLNINEGDSSAQGMGALAFQAGDGLVQSTFTSTSANLTFGSLTARSTGGIGNFVVSGGAAGTSAANANGTLGTNNIIITGQATGVISQGNFFGGSNYAYYDGAGFVRALDYVNDVIPAGAATSGATTSLASATHQEITGAISAQNDVTFTTLKVNGANNITINAGQTLTTNGLLKTGGNSSTISGGTVRPGSNAELVIRTDASGDVLTINSTLAANGTNALTKSGAGRLNLRGGYGLTGNIAVNDGTLQLGVLSDTTFGGVLSGTGALVKTGTGKLTINGATGSAATFSGNLQINNSTVVLDMSGMTTPVDLLNAGSLLALSQSATDSVNNGVARGGGTLIVKGKSTGVSSQTLFTNSTRTKTGLTVNTGTSYILADPNGGDETRVLLGWLGNVSNASRNYGGVLVLGKANGAGSGNAVFTMDGNLDNLTFNGGRAGGRILWASEGGAIGTDVNFVATAYNSSNPCNIFPVGTNGTSYPVVTGNVGDSGSSYLVNGSVTANLAVMGLKIANLADSAQVLTLTGSNRFDGGILMTGDKDFKITGGTMSTPTTGGDGSIVISNYSSGVLTVETVMDRNGNGTFVKSGPGKVVLSGLNTYTGSGTTTYFNEGIVQANSVETAGTSGPFGKDTGAGRFAFAGGTLQYSAVNQFDYSSRFGTGGGEPIKIDTFGQTVTFATNLQGTATELTVNDTAVTKGTLTLSGTNSYTGPTTVSAGTLLINGLNNGTGAVTVASVATLGGIGTIAGSTTIDGNHAPGLSAGIQTFSNGLAYLAASNLKWELNDDVSEATTGVRGTDFDGVNVTGGAFSITSGATIDLSFGGLVDFLDSFWDTNQSWKVVDLSGSVTGDGGSGLFSVGTFTGATPSGGSFNVSRVSDGTWNDVFLNWVASAGGPSYATWAAAFSSPVLSDQAADADPDFDGLENALEYVIGSDPRVSNQGGPSGGVVGTNLVLNLTRVDSSETADVGLKVQVSTDLQDWTTIGSYTIGADTGSSTSGVVVNEGTPTSDPDAITITIPKGVDVKKFARVIVTITP